MNLPKLLSLEFSPGFAVYTFPFVISATALKKTYVFLDMPLLKHLSSFQLIVSILAILYVSLKFMKFFISKPTSSEVIKQQIS